MTQKRFDPSKFLSISIAWVIYSLFYIGLFPRLGAIVSAFALIPAVVTGMQYGKIAGLIGGIAVSALNIALKLLVGGGVENLIGTADVVGYIIFILLGISVGHLHDIQQRLKNELQERERIEHKLRDKNKEILEQRQYFETLFRNSPIAIVTLDIDDNIRDCNPTFTKLFEYDKDEIIGEDLDSLIVPLYQLKEAKNLTLSAAQGESVHHIGKRRTKSGELIDVELFGVPVLSNGQHLGTLALYHDITVQNRLAAETQKLSKVVEQSATPIFITHIDGKITYVNSAFSQVSGYSKKELIGENPRLFKSDLLPKKNYELLWQSIQSGITYEMVTPNRRKDGDLWYYDQTIHPLTDETGKIISYVSTGKDITAQIEAEEALRISENRFRNLFNDSPVALWEEDFSEVKLAIDEMKNSGDTDIHAYLEKNPLELTRLIGLIKIININQAVLNITGAKTNGELLNNISKMSTDREKEVWKEQFSALNQGKTTFKTESSHKTLQGEIKHTYIRVNIAPGYEKSWKRVLISQSDITELKMVQAELRVAKQEAEKAANAKAEFLANMSHEIRTPLNAVVGMSSLLMDTALDKDQIEYVETVRSSSDVLLATINDILDFSKIEAGKLELEKQLFYLRELVESTLDLVAPRMAEKHLDLAYVMDEDIPPKLKGDSNRIRQILANLLSNAEKFTDQGEVVVLISCDRIGDDQYKIHFQVRDTGIGIPPDRINRLFKSFTQIDASTTRKYGGTGLGLAISKQLTELMGGEIWVESEVGSGSTFHFTILVEGSYGTDIFEPDVEQTSLTGKRLLIVDDNQTNRLIVKKYAEKWGMLPTEAKSGKDALSIVKKGTKFDLAIIDYQMPEMDGITLASKLRSNSKTKHTLLLLLSSMSSYKQGAKEKKLFSAYIYKPIKPSHLLEAITAVMTKKTTRSLKRKISDKVAFDPKMGKKFPMDILLVEDYPVNQKVAYKLLGKFGYRVDIARNGVEAIDALEQTKYQVIFMDIQMPEMDGEEATRNIRENWSRDEHPWIIAMTAHALEGDREHFLSIGMDDYISKPLDIKELHRVLERIPEKYRQQGKKRSKATK